MRKYARFDLREPDTTCTKQSLRTLTAASLRTSHRPFVASACSDVRPGHVTTIGLR
jgi:hypothetical protein